MLHKDNMMDLLRHTLERRDITRSHQMAESSINSMGRPSIGVRLPFYIWMDNNAGFLRYYSYRSLLGPHLGPCLVEWVLDRDKKQLIMREAPLLLGADDASIWGTKGPFEELIVAHNVTGISWRLLIEESRLPGIGSGVDNGEGWSIDTQTLPGSLSDHGEADKTGRSGLDKLLGTR